MIKSYELVVLLTPDYVEQDVQVVQDKISAMVKKLKGNVTSVEVWGKRPLAYTLKKHTEAWYVQFIIEMDTLNVVMIDREISLQPDVIRHLLVIPEPKQAKVEVKMPEIDLEA